MGATSTSPFAPAANPAPGVVANNSVDPVVAPRTGTDLDAQAAAQVRYPTYDPCADNPEECAQQVRTQERVVPTGDDLDASHAALVRYPTYDPCADNPEECAPSGVDLDAANAANVRYPVWDPSADNPQGYAPVIPQGESKAQLEARVSELMLTYRSVQGELSGAQVARGECASFDGEAQLQCRRDKDAAIAEVEGRLRNLHSQISALRARIRSM